MIAPSASGASSASTTRSSAASSPAAGACRRSSPSAIERHHSAEATGLAAAVRLADLIVHHTPGDHVSADAMREAAEPADSPTSACARSSSSFPHAQRRASAAGALPALASARSTRCAASPRARSTSRSPRSWGSRRARSAPTCTTSTARSAPQTEPRPCSWLAKGLDIAAACRKVLGLRGPPAAHGSVDQREGLVDQSMSACRSRPRAFCRAPRPRQERPWCGCGRSRC